MNTFEAIDYFKIEPKIIESAISGFWVKVIHANGGRVFSIDEPTTDEDFNIFETQFAVALGFTDAPELEEETI